MRCMLQMRKGEDAVKYVQKRSRDQRSMKQGRDCGEFGEGDTIAGIMYAQRTISGIEKPPGKQ